MQWTRAHYEQIKHLLPKQRGNVEIDNQTFFEAMIHITENGLRRRADHSEICDMLLEKAGINKEWYKIYKIANPTIFKIEGVLNPILDLRWYL